MNDDRDDEFTELLADFDAGLAEGCTSGDAAETSVDLDEDLSQRLADAKDCLRLIEQAWPRSTNDGELAVSSPFLAGGFRVIRELGRGGFGIVYLVEDDKLARRVALKVQRPEAVLSHSLRSRFLREARAAARLRHPNIAAVHEVGHDGLRIWVASEYCDGGSLAGWLQTEHIQVSPQSAAGFMAVLADALEYSHQQGVLHRDLKPGNVLLQCRQSADDAEALSASDLVSYTPKLIDFGLAKLNEGEQQETRTGVLLGTPAYMSPEQANGQVHQNGPATDVWGLGTILYELLTNSTVFRGASDADTLRRIVTEEPVNPRRLRPDLPCDLEAICLKCLEKQPSNRYPTAGALAADLRRFLTGRPTLARPLTPTQRAGKWVRRRPALAGLMAVSATALLILISLTIAYIWQLRVARHTAESLRNEAETIAATSRRHEQDANQLLYASQVHVAYQWLEQGEIERVAKILAAYEEPGPLAHLRGFEWFHLKRRLHGERLTLTGHRGEVYAVAFAPNGRELASGAQDGTIKFWNPASGQRLGTVPAHGNCVNSLAYSPDGSLLASGSCDHRIRLWNATTRELVDTLEGHADNVQCVAFSPTDGNLLASCGNGPFVNVWDVSTREIIWSFDTGRRSISSLAWRFDGKTLFLACDVALDGLGAGAGVEIDVDDHRVIATRNHFCRGVAGSLQRADFWTGMSDGTIRKIRDGEPRDLDPETRFGNISAIAISRDGSRIATGGDGTIRVLNATSNRWKETLTGHSGRVQALAFSPDGQSLASCSFDGTIKLWDVLSHDGEAFTTDLYLDAMLPENSVAISPDFQRLAVRHRHDAVRILNLKDGTLHTELTSVAKTHGLQFIDGGRVLFGLGMYAANTVDEWDLEQHASRKTHRLPSADVTGLALGSNGDRLVVAGPMEFHIRDTATERVLRSVKIREPHDQQTPQLHLCFSPDGKDFAISTPPYPAGFILRAGDEALTGESESTVRAISNGAALLADAGEAANTVVLVDSHSQRRLAALQHATGVIHCAFSPDAETLASICSDGAVYLWNVRTGQEITRFETRAGIGVRVQFSHDGRQLAAVTQSDALAYHKPDGSQIVGSQQCAAHLFIWSGLDRLSDGH